jgi:8-oxo-dGTP pyrophosphatase MutT (NUDIX family)
MGLFQIQGGPAMLHPFSAFKNLYFFLGTALFLLIGCVHGLVPNGTPLEDILYSGASVLPVTASGQVLLSREAAGRHQGTWDSCGGGRHPDEFNCMTTATREFYEEAILQKTLGWDFAATEQFIEPAHPHTTLVIAKELGADVFVMVFVTELSDQQVDQLITRYGQARQSSTEWKYKEKDGLALVEWKDLAAAILNTPRGETVRVSAHVVYPTDETTTITVRPYLVSNLRPYLEDHSFTSGSNPKVRYYQ